MPTQGQPTFDITPEFQPVSQQIGISSYDELNKVLAGAGQLGADVIQKPLLEHAKQKGKIEGAQEDFKPSRFSFTGIGIAENNAAIQSHTALISTDITNKVNQTYAKWSTPKSAANPNGGLDQDSFKNYTNEMAVWSKTYLGNMYPVFRGDAANKLAILGSDAGNKLMKSVGKITQNEEAANILTGAKQSGNTINNLAFGGDVTKATAIYDEQDTNMQQGVATGAIKPIEYSNVMAPLLKGLHKNTWLGRAHRAIPLGEIDKFHDEVNNSKMGELDKYNMNTKGNAMNSNFITQTSADHVAVENQMHSNLTAQRTSGANYSHEIANKMAEINPNAALLYHKLSGMMQDSYDMNKNIQWTNIDNSRLVLNAIKINPNDPELFHKQQVLVSAQNANENRIKALQDNPAEFSSHAPSVISAVQNLEESKGFNDLTDNEKGTQIKLVQSSSQLAFQKASGLPEDKWSVLTSGDAQRLSNVLKSGDPGTQQATIEAIAQSYGANMKYALRDMQKYHVPQSIMDLVGLNDPRLDKSSSVNLPTVWQGLMTSDKDLNDGIVAKGKKASDYVKAVNSTMGDFVKTFGNGSLAVQTYKRNMLENVMRAAKMDTIAHGTSPSDAVDKMAKVIYFNRYNQTKGVRIPKGVSPQLANLGMAAAAWAVHQGKITFTPMKRIPTNDRVRQIDAQKDDELSYKAGNFRNMGDDTQGVEWVSGNNIKAFRSADGKPFRIKWSDLEIPGSEINQLIGEYKASGHASMHEMMISGENKKVDTQIKFF